VTAVRVDALNAENKRRVKQEHAKQDKFQRLQDEAIESTKRNAAVQMRWASIIQHNLPQDLKREIELQRDACKEIIASKRSLRDSFVQELKDRDEEYVKALEDQEKDISRILQQMKSQYEKLESSYATEITNIEEAFMQDRSKRLGDNTTEIENLFERRRVMEVRFMEEKQNMEEQYANEIETMRRKDAENYNKLKVKLENDVQILEQQLEEMRATYQLNYEKLEYNHRVLTERNRANKHTLGDQKRTLTRRKDQLQRLMKQYHDLDMKARQENDELTEKYRSITKQYKDLQGKFKHFEVADHKKYRDLWKMHEEEITKLVNKLLDADKIIHEQILGLEWVAPENTSRESMLLKKPAQEIEETADTVDEEPEQKEVTDPGRGQMFVSNAKISKMLELLCEEAGFLIDEKVRQALDAMNEQEGSQVKAESILKALGITSHGPEWNRLISFFFDPEEKQEGSDLQDQNLSEGKGSTTLGLKVRPENVIKVITKFIQEREDLPNKAEGTLAAEIEQEEQKATMQRNAEKRREMLEKNYWNRMTNIIPDRHTRIWQTLEGAMVDYNGILKERESMIHEVSNLQNENKELRALLDQYINSQINEELHIPPTHVIQMPMQ